MFVFLMVSHYVLSIAMLIYMWGDTLPGTARMFRLHPLWVVGTTLAYIVPHMYAWVSFSQSVKKPR